MTATKWVWVSLVVIYLALFSWYTSFEGPLSEEEIEHYFSLLQDRAEPADPELVAILRDFMESDTGDDFVMWNVVDLYDEPLQIEGVEAGETSEEVAMKYMAFMLPELLKRACHPVISGTAAAQAPEMFGLDGVRRWDQAVGMRYRSRRDLLDIASNPEFRGSHEFKVAAIEKTFAFPIDPWFQLGDPRLVLALVFAVIGLAVAALRRA